MLVAFILYPGFIHFHYEWSQSPEWYANPLQAMKTNLLEQETIRLMPWLGLRCQSQKEHVPGRRVSRTKITREAYLSSVSNSMCRNKLSESHSVLSDSLRSHGIYSPWDPPGQHTGVGSLSLLQRIFPTQGLNPVLQHFMQILYQLSQKGSPGKNKTSNKTKRSRARHKQKEKKKEEEEMKL